MFAYLKSKFYRNSIANLSIFWNFSFKDRFSRESIFEREVPKYTQIGNAVPVKLAFEIGKHFKKLLK